MKWPVNLMKFSDESDLWIAATARAVGAVLVTRDKDFRRLKQLAVEDWTAVEGK